LSVHVRLDRFPKTLEKLVKALIFGASGQDAHYLTRLCAERGIETIGVSRAAGGDWLVGDVGRREQVDALVGKHRPDYIFHLGANSTTRHDAVFENHETVSTGALNVLEAARKLAPQARVFLAGSGLQFVNRGKPISETDSFEANSAYAVARIQSVYAARYYRRLGVRAYVGYLFHHDSPLRKPHHVSQKIAQAVRRIAGGSEEILEIGDISVLKEWAFAGDIACAILSLVEQEAIFEACIGTGKAYSIEDWLMLCFSQAGLDWREHVKTGGRFTPEYGCLVSDPSQIKSLGWHPKVDFPALAAMMLQI
jgi:GDPmannose 4,6-dehydratase